MSNLGFGRPRRNAAEQPRRAYCWGTSTAVTTLTPGTPMRPFFPLLALATLLAAPARAQQPARPDTARAQRPGGQAEGPKPYAEVITKAATTDSGVFIISDQTISDRGIFVTDIEPDPGAAIGDESAFF